MPEGIDLQHVNLYIGTKGKIITGIYGSGYNVLLDGYQTPPETIERVPDHELGGGRHEMDWVRACKEDKDSRKEACSNFEFAGPFTEMVLMGNLAIRLQGLRRELEWDGEKMEFENIGTEETLQLITSKTDHGEVNALEFTGEMIKHTYREGWSW